MHLVNWYERLPSGAMPMLNLAVYPPAARSSPGGAKVPHATARWAARPLAVSARMSGAPAQKHQADHSKSINGSLVMQRPNIIRCTAPSPSLTGLTGRCTRTLTVRIASATPYGRR